MMSFKPEMEARGGQTALCLHDDTPGGATAHFINAACIGRDSSLTPHPWMYFPSTGFALR